MSTLEAVRNAILADAVVVGLVGDRIYPNVREQDGALPAVVITVVSELTENSFTGTAETRLSFAVVQIDTYATSYPQARALATAIQNVVANLSSSDLSAVHDTSRDSYDDAASLHRISSDYHVAR